MAKGFVVAEHPTALRAGADRMSALPGAARFGVCGYLPSLWSGVTRVKLEVEALP
jgi:hypothetical protein